MRFFFSAKLWLAVLTVQILLLTNPARASDIIEALPLTRDIVMIHFYDSYAIYHKNGAPRSNEKAVVLPLQAAQAQMAGNYQIYSADDAAYNNHLSPVSVGRKSKGAEFTWLCQGWNETSGCINTDPDRVQEHWIYLILPAPMQSGNTYTISTGTLAENGSEWTFTFDEKNIRSEAVHVNMIGYAIINDISYTENHDISARAYPNPFSSQITIECSLKSNCHLSLEIYDILGKKINSLQMGYHKVGVYQVIWDGTDANNLPVSPGAYICRFENSDKPDNDIKSKNILLLKNQ